MIYSAVCAYYCGVSFIKSEQIGAILHLTLNRPEKKNAITQDMYQELATQINNAAGDFGIRVLVLSSTGDSFTAGNDINDFANNPQMHEGSPVFNFLFAIPNFPKPLIAAVKGRAVGIGTTMLMHCDLVTANSDTKFSMPFVSCGNRAAYSLLLSTFPRRSTWRITFKLYSAASSRLKLCLARENLRLVI